MKDEEKASGIECDLSEVEKALEEIAEKEAAAEDTVESDKKKADNAKASMHHLSHTVLQFAATLQVVFVLYCPHYPKNLMDNITQCLSVLDNCVGK